MGRSSQRKGADGERELAELLKEYGYQVERGPSQNYGTVPDLTGLSGIHCEVKRCEQLRPYEWMQQAVDDSERFQDGMPVVFFRKNRKPWLVLVRLNDFMNLYRRYHDDYMADS